MDAKKLYSNNSDFEALGMNFAVSRNTNITNTSEGLNADYPASVGAIETLLVENMAEEQAGVNLVTTDTYSTKIRSLVSKLTAQAGRSTRYGMGVVYNYIYNMRVLVAEACQLMRAIKIAKSATAMDPSVPMNLLVASGYNPVIDGNTIQLGDAIVDLHSAVGRLLEAIPIINLPIFHREAYMFGTVFKDSQENKPVWYVYNNYQFPQLYSETTTTSITDFGTLTSGRLIPSISARVKAFSQHVSVAIKAMDQELLSDIYRVYRDNTFDLRKYVKPIDLLNYEASGVEAVFDEIQLHEIMNSIIYTGHTYGAAIRTSSSGGARQNITVTPFVQRNAQNGSWKIEWSAQYVEVEGYKSYVPGTSQYFANGFDRKYPVNSYLGPNLPKETQVAITRGMPICTFLKADSATDPDDIRSRIVITAAGTDVPINFTMYYQSEGDGPYDVRVQDVGGAFNVGISYAQFSSNTSLPITNMAKAVAVSNLLSAMDYHPMVRFGAVGYGGWSVLLPDVVTTSHPAWALSQYTIVSDASLAAFHNVATSSLLAAPASNQKYNESSGFKKESKSKGEGKDGHKRK